jgi:hypothetical protein
LRTSANFREVGQVTVQEPSLFATSGAHCPQRETECRDRSLDVLNHFYKSEQRFVQRDKRETPSLLRRGLQRFGCR